MELIFDDKTGTWGEATEVYGTIKCPTKEDYEYALNAIKSHKQLEDKHWDECRQIIAHYDNELSKHQKEMPKIVEYIDCLRSLPVNRWISVKERLPEDDGKYMVWYKGELDICEFDAESQKFGYTYDDYDEMYSHLVCWDDGIDKDITHWMPLPEPPSIRTCPMTTYPTDCTDECKDCDCGGSESEK